MRHWDASALVPLCIEEATSATLRPLASHGTIVTWCLSGVEITSAIERRAREGQVSAEGRTQALAMLALLTAAWSEIHAVSSVRDRALRLLASHKLRAADALQLAAALVGVSDRPAAHEFVCLDERLRDAAGREGFKVLPVER